MKEELLADGQTELKASSTPSNNRKVQSIIGDSMLRLLKFFHTYLLSLVQGGHAAPVSSCRKLSSEVDILELLWPTLQ